MKFIADYRVGRLAKWLRILGYNVAYTVPISDAGLLRRATAEGCILLTRDTRLIARCRKPGHVYKFGSVPDVDASTGPARTFSGCFIP